MCFHKQGAVMLDCSDAIVLDAETPMDVELDSVTLARLVEEVRTKSVEPTAYNRQHNRHNKT